MEIQRGVLLESFTEGGAIRQDSPVGWIMWRPIAYESWKLENYGIRMDQMDYGYWTMGFYPLQSHIAMIGNVIIVNIIPFTGISYSSDS